MPNLSLEPVKIFFALILGFIVVLNHWPREVGNSWQHTGTGPILWWEMPLYYLMAFFSLSVAFQAIPLGAIRPVIEIHD